MNRVNFHAIDTAFFGLRSSPNGKLNSTSNFLLRHLFMDYGWIPDIRQLTRCKTYFVKIRIRHVIKCFQPYNSSESCIDLQKELCPCFMYQLHELFDWSITQLEAEGWTLSEVTHDLHERGPVGVMTDYEAKFYEQGLKINRLVAAKTADTKTTAAGAVPRLRNASLTDARGYEESREANRRSEP